MLLFMLIICDRIGKRGLPHTSNLQDSSDKAILQFAQQNSARSGETFGLVSNFNVKL